MTEREQIEKEIEEYEKRRAGLISDDRSLHELEGRIGGLLLCITELASVLPPDQRETFIVHLRQAKDDIGTPDVDDLLSDAEIHTVNHVLLRLL